MSQILLDTDIISYYMRGDERVVANYAQHIDLYGFVYVSRISILEILGGLKVKNATTQIQRFRNFLAQNQILELTENASEIASDVFATLYKMGKHSGNYDILIASIAIENSLTLCTNNLKDYQNIPNLNLINWK
ncbi:MAG: type II toxin-antitoxin system VapC family toxin [Bacteroidetes bacterium]|nr:MAG: type II toxin-antitoxin system VapC family toxin [Bacteroidota bacterium]